jgi:hypothetical protein
MYRVPQIKFKTVGGIDVTHSENILENIINDHSAIVAIRAEPSECRIEAKYRRCARWNENQFHF